MRRINRRILVIVAAVLAVLVLSGGIAFAMANNNGSPANAAAACATTPAAHGKGKGAGASDHIVQTLTRLVGSGISGTLVVADSTAPGGYLTVTFARGQVSAIDTTTGRLTVQLPNSTTQMFTLGTSAQIQIGKKAGTIASLQPGMNVLVISRQAQGQPAIVSVLVEKAPRASNTAGATPTTTANS